MTTPSTLLWWRMGLLLVSLLLSGTVALAQHIGIGTNAPTQTLDVNGNLRVRSLSNPGSNGRLLSVLPDGTLTAGERLGTLSGLGASSQLLPSPVLSPIPLGNNTFYADEATDGRYLYILGDNEVRVYDMATPTQPTLAAQPTALRPNAGGIRLAVANGYAYVVNGTDMMDVYQLTTPTTFTFRRTIVNRPAGASATAYMDMTVSGNYLYYVGNFPGLSPTVKLLTYDLTDPANPALLNMLDVPNSRGEIRPVHLAADERTNTLYAHIGGYPYSLYQMAAPGVPTTLRTTGSSSSTSPRLLLKMSILGGTLYQINVDAQQLHILDVSNSPASPQDIVTIPTPARVYGIDIIGRYAYLFSQSSSGYAIYAVQVGAPSVLAFDPNGNISTQSAVLPTISDNLGNHTAVQNLNLASYQLVGNGGGSGLSISSSGQVGIGTTTPAATLDVNGATRATNLTATDAVQAGTVLASTNVQTFAVLTPATGNHNMLVQAYGSIGSAGNAYGSTDNYSVNHTPGSNTYRIRFTPASGLGSTTLSAAVVNLTLYGTNPGFATYTATESGSIDVTTTNANGQAAERGFSFTVYLP
ncbi:hypothetical protein H8B15_03210 [Hymenobacter sp. BT507]|uniref:DUF4394 domain-containing protein n=1 Tax=Hymenobacter citatus TaxID=2763506 RepID=A0ABR7MFT3_9BACT|nr:hypothetical protein [Hymenobacter citatus]MBC6609915.1 hypothetical protein [Hymenobacter citatus]